MPDDAFRRIARDGAGMVEGQGRVLRALDHADPRGLGPPARRLAAEVIGRAVAAGLAGRDLHDLRARAARPDQSGAPPA